MITCVFRWLSSKLIFSPLNIYFTAFLRKTVQPFTLFLNKVCYVFELAALIVLVSERTKATTLVQRNCKVSNNIIVEMIPLINPFLSSNPWNDKIKQHPVTSKMCSSFPGWVLSFDLWSLYVWCLGRVCRSRCWRICVRQTYQFLYREQFNSVSISYCWSWITFEFKIWRNHFDDRYVSR